MTRETSSGRIRRVPAGAMPIPQTFACARQTKALFGSSKTARVPYAWDVSQWPLVAAIHATPHLLRFESVRGRDPP
jgi:hypothetical protein